jgi:hypothetical protein
MVRFRDSTGQPELNFSASQEDPAPKVSVAQVEALVAVLTGKGWVEAAELARQLGEKWSDRKVRAVARAAAPGIVSYPGSPGYKIWGECSVEEIDHAIAAFESQANDMTARALLYRNAYHRRFRG